MGSDLIIEINTIENRIFTIRNQKVMLDRDLAALYGVLTKNFNKAVKRNIEKFPPEFMFQLTEEEWSILRFQIGTANKNISKVRFLPYVFTEHGVLMSANILNSEKANIISVEIIKVFIKLRNYALSQSSQDSRIDDLRKILMLHIESNDNKFSEYDETINQIINVLNNLIEQPKPKKQIGFTAVATD